LIIACLKSFSQNVAINTTGNAANASAMLDVSANNKGLLIPRMTTTERQAIASPANGLMVFDITSNTFWYFSTTWKELNGGGGAGFVLPYTGTGNDPGKLFSILNTNTNVIGTAIYGKKSIGSGLVAGMASGVLGESSGGSGVIGLCDSGYGVLGFSTKNHAIYGSAYTPGYAGVYGVASNMNTYGVMGETSTFNTVGVYAKSGAYGRPAFFEITDPSNPDTTLILKTIGSGEVLNLQLNNAFNSNNALSARTMGFGSSIFAQSDKGIGGYFKKTNNANSNEVLRIENTANVGDGLYVNMSNGSDLGSAIAVNHLGQGRGIYMALPSPANNNYMIEGYTGGTGGGISLSVSNTIATGDGLHIYNEGSGYGVYSAVKKGNAGWFTSYPGNNKPTLSASNDGNAISFQIFQNNAANTNAAAFISVQGTGPGLIVSNNNANSVSSLATFEKNGQNKARIDGTGKGYFNGGTQNSGADVAEVFDVTGNIQQYETGDVLVISTDKDRTVEKSSGAYSTLVSGVYATKPGVLLTEENIEADISGKIPMGVVGVIPTKVCLEGGEIKRGDLLVTSSIAGVAMKADPEKVKPGQVIGKALENFVTNSVGKIKVLVNVK